jgi:quercetin dioxygenase-like cupin family protein
VLVLKELKIEKMYREKSMFITESAMYYEKRSLNSSDLAVLIASLKNEQTWVEGELKSAVLLRSPAKKIVLTVLHKGTEISSFQSDDSVTIQVIEGKLKLGYGSKSSNLRKGEVLIINEKVHYKIDSLEDSALLMILASGKEN